MASTNFGNTSLIISNNSHINFSDNIKQNIKNWTKLLLWSYFIYLHFLKNKTHCTQLLLLLWNLEIE